MADLKRTVDSNSQDTTYILKKAIKALENTLLICEHATPGDLPDGAGSTASWILDVNVSGATATNALTDDGGTPITYSTRASFNEDAYVPTAVTKQVHTYGTFVPVRAKDMKNMPKGTMDRLGQRMGYRARHTKDTLARATLDGSGTGFNPSMGAGTTTVRASIGSGTNNTTIEATDQLTAEDIALATGDLWGADAETFSNGMYAAVVHTASAIHLITDVSASRLNWQEINKYVGGASGQDKIPNGNIGAIVDTMVFKSNNITTATVDTENSYRNLVLAADAFGQLSLEDSDPDIIVRTADGPYGDKGFKTVAFVLDDACTLLDSARVVKLHAAD